MRNEDIKSKIKQTNLRKYGVENPSKTQAIKNKIGLKNSLNWERTKVKYKNTMEKRYGVEWGGQIAKGITTRVAKFKDKQIKEKDFLIGYDGDDWICKCPMKIAPSARRGPILSNLAFIMIGQVEERRPVPTFYHFSHPFQPWNSK